MNVEKYQDSKVSHLIAHDLRLLPHDRYPKDENIDFDKTKQNYSLINRGATIVEVTAYRKSIEKEIHIYNRKNVIHAVEVVLQKPDDCPEEQEEAFFQAAYDYLCSTLPMGEKSVFVAQIHKDEIRYDSNGNRISKDHLHFAFVPAVPDKKHADYHFRLCADELISRTYLRKLHPGLQDYLKKNGIQGTVYKGGSGGRLISLNAHQMKEITDKTGIILKDGLTIDGLAEIINESAELSSIREEIKILRSQVQLLAQTANEKDAELKAAYKAASELREKLEEAESKPQKQTWGHAEEWGNVSGWGQSQAWGQTETNEITETEKEE